MKSVYVGRKTCECIGVAIDIVGLEPKTIGALLKLVAESGLIIDRVNRDDVIFFETCPHVKKAYTEMQLRMFDKAETLPSAQSDQPVVEETYEETEPEEAPATVTVEDPNDWKYETESAADVLIDSAEVETLEAVSSDAVQEDQELEY